MKATLGRAAQMRRYLATAVIGSVDRPSPWARRMAWFLITMAGSCTALFMLKGGTIHRRFEWWMLDRAVEEARVLRQEGREGEALGSLVKMGLEAVRAGHRPTLAMLADLALDEYPREALDLYRQAARFGRLERHERAEMALLLVRLGQRTEGMAQLMLLAREDPSDTRLVRLISEVQGSVAGLAGTLRYARPEQDEGDLRVAELERLDISSSTASEEELMSCITRWQALRPAELERVARWLMSHGHARLVAAHVSDSAAFSRASLLALKIDALMTLQSWQQALALIDDQRSPLPEVTRLVLRGLVACRQPDGNKDLARRGFEQVLRVAKRDRMPGLAAAVSGIAQQHGMEPLALEAMTLQLSLGFATLDVLERHLGLSRRLGRDAGEVLQELSAIPGIRDLGSEAELAVCYLKLLAGEEVEWCRRQLTLLRGRIPYAHRLDLLEALAAYREGRHVEAGNIVSRLQEARLSGWETAVAAGILAHTGNRTMMRGQIMAADRSILLAEEYKLLSRWWTAERWHSRPKAEEWRTFAGPASVRVQTGW